MNNLELVCEFFETKKKYKREKKLRTITLEVNNFNKTPSLTVYFI